MEDTQDHMRLGVLCHSVLRRIADNHTLTHATPVYANRWASHPRRWRPRRPRLHATIVCVTVLFLMSSILKADAMVIHRPWTTQHWCRSVKAPRWPFAFQKLNSQQVEWKGRTNSNDQDMRHECSVLGVESKCHRCEDIACGSGSATAACAYQIQGVDWAALPKNIPTVTDVPWAVGSSPKHRYDYASATGVCLFVSGGDCITPSATDYSRCVVRCWGASSGAIQTRRHPERGDAATLANGDADASDIWSFPTTFTGDGKPQGQVTTLAGSGVAGFQDGPMATARFSNPQDVAVDSTGVVYVADTDNHRVRKIDPVTGIVTTLAGDGTEGYADGAAASARFSFPTGVAVFEDPSSGGKIVVFVADTGNHRIRKIVDGVVSCFAGLCGNGVESAILAALPARPHAGLADGDTASSRFDSPMGIAVDLAGVVFVADTGNHLIRRIDPDGTTTTLAGNVVPSNDVDTPGCVSPCVKGVAGFRDGNLTYAQFNSPRDVTVGPQSTLVVADGHRIRRVNYDGTTSILEGVTSKNRVVTLAGSNMPGNIDGSGDEATLHAPAGVTVSADGRVYVVSPITCKLRQLSSATQVARPVTCTTRLTQVLLPSGCSSYEPPVDELNLRVSPVTNNIYYNYRQRRVSDSIDGPVLLGRQIKDCTGTPPVDAFEVGDRSLAKRNATTQQVITDEKEDQEDGTTIKIACPAGCGAASGATVYGSFLYSDESAICAAAIHAGVITDTSGGLVELMLERGVQYYNTTVRAGSLANGVTSLDLPAPATSTTRLFSGRVYPLAQIEVHTVAGAPSAQLKSGCGFADGMPPLASKFNGPHGVEIYSQHSPSRSRQLVVADSGNHRIRRMTASCSKICENGGVCVATDTCACAAGWSGDDCSIPVCSSPCSGRQVCVGPDTCACIPGYTGAPACSTPLCVQTCANGGSCSAPDTCSCASGWFDSNCTTPVCAQTCGNGGNCTAPSTCSCPSEWSGVDCRVPVCSQPCQNGGSCVAPNTCLCAAGWSGHDCAMPVCPQGVFVPHPSGFLNALWRPFSFENYVPCDLPKWCLETNEFDCLAQLQSPVVGVGFGASGRARTGRVLDPRGDPLTNSLARGCLLIELGDTALTQYQYLNEQNVTSGYFRFAPKVPFGWNASGAPWRGLDAPEIGFLPPFNHASDRQVALVEKRSVVQGVYACANGGSCVTPGVCQCAAGWIGFDCRTPVCNQGYYAPTQLTYFAADPPESKDPRQPTSNPQYTTTVETLVYDAVTTTTATRGGVRYLQSGGSSQGGYACSSRSITQWEKPATIGPYASAEYYFEHPNYFSGYMDKTLQVDGYYHTYWEGMFWPPLYVLSQPLLDDTREGWKRGGTWSRVANSKWQKGKCLVQFNRTCSRNPVVDLLTQTAQVVTDTDASYRPQASYSISRATRVGFWNQSVSGDCVDQVVRGCYNNGTCVAPDTCLCAAGWKGPDCSVPICDQTCLHNGNCTLPNRCTCEIGWTGRDCSIPMCAQECRNGGKCVAPDKCECVQWASKWHDGRENGGAPVFKTPEGLAQMTGYTGYDCNTPICVQAERFVLNTKRDTDGFLSLRGHGKTGKDVCSTYRCPQFDEELISNDGASFQSGCSVGNPLPNPQGVTTFARRMMNIRNYNDSRNIMRVSDSFLCGNLVWEQGDYKKGRYIRTNYINITKIDDETWDYGVTTPGEGVFMCYNKGSCIAPDTCSCGDGWQGIDCNMPICRFLQANGSVVTGCLNDGVCVDKDTCQCITVESILHVKHPTSPRGLTGYTGSDCAAPMCVQGVFDPLCSVSGAAGVDGCYRCKNGGVCVAPDVCKCADGWTGFDCSEPICALNTTVVNATVQAQLFTVDDQKVLAFMADPCGSNGGRWGKEWINGALVGQGNCTVPRKCTCLCRQKYDAAICKQTGDFCEKPWQDPFRRSIPAGFVYGTRNCVDGFQGLEDKDGNFISCHLQIYVPSLYRRYTVSMIALLSVLGVAVLIAWHYIRKNIRRRRLLAKAERRRSRKNSEENPQDKRKSGAFVHAKQA